MAADPTTDQATGRSTAPAGPAAGRASAPAGPATGPTTPGAQDPAAVLGRFTPATREWFTGAFAAPTPAQLGAWDAISSGQHALVVAPTGSGKTLSAFLWALDGFLRPRERPAGGDAPAAGPGQDPLPGAPPAPAAGTGTSGKRPKELTRVLYVSPLKALGVDVERNLRAPLIGITQTARRLGVEAPEVRVGVRSGDTPARERRQLVSHPPDILITTPESLYLMLTSQARSTLAGVETVIVDEVHAVAGTKRGAHLAVSLERLDALLPAPAQRIGLSATVEPKEEVARFLGGIQPVRVVAPGSAKSWDVHVTVPVPDMTELPAAAAAHDLGPGSGLQAQASIWPHVEERIVDLVARNRSTIVFANSRRLAERLTGRLNEIWEERLAAAAEGVAAGTHGTAGTDGLDGAGPAEPARLGDVLAGVVPGRTGGDRERRGAPAQVMAQAGQSAGTAAEGTGGEFARAHHGSVSKEQRALIEDALKTGRLRCVVATSSLELGIDMGAVDLVIQVESPPSVASGLQRVGRAGHQVGETSTGWFFPKHRGDLVDTAVVVERMLAGRIESLSVPANPLDILAQQTVAACALDEIDAEDWFDRLRRTAPFATLPHSAYESVLDLLSGRYPSDEFAELRPRVVWDREAGTLTGRNGSQWLAVTSGGTIPDRGLFGVFLAGSEDRTGGADGPAAAGTARTGGRRVGELDEEMVYESRVGDVIVLGATSWQIQDITHDRVLVLPAFGQPGKLPFWRGDAEGRPAELGAAVGAFRREVEAALGPDGTPSGPAGERLAAAGLDGWARDNLAAYLSEQRESTGVVPTERTLVVERFLDELSDWRVVLHSPFGMPVHAPWALAVGARLHARYGMDGSAMAADDGIVLRVPMMDDEPPGADLFLFTAEELDELVTAEVGGSALFAARFRENAARALLLPRRDPGRRSPLWQQRQRAAQLLEVARKYPQFPVILETVRECLQDVYDLPALKDLAGRIEAKSVRLVETTTKSPSPFAQSLLFGYVAQFIYEGDSPLAERRAAALSLDPGLLNELLGRAELADLLDAEVIATVEADLQRLSPARRVRGAEGLADLLRLLGPLTAAEAAARLQSGRPPEAEAGAVAGAVAAGAAGVVAGAGDEGAPDDGAVEPVAAEPPVAPPAGEEEAAELLDGLVAAHRALRIRLAGREHYAAVEDAARLRDALGVALPMGVPLAFIEPVADPLGDLVSRYARTHGPFTATEAGAALGLGAAVVLQVLQRLAAERRVTEGRYRPGGESPAGPLDAEWCEVEVLRRIRRRSLAALRAEVEPVEQPAYARFLADWQHLEPAPGGGSPATLRGIDGVATVLEQLAGVPVPASAWESHVLPARVRDYAPAQLDELLASGEFLWAGTAAAAGTDGWIAFHPAETVDLGIVRAEDFEPGPVHRALEAVLDGGGAWFFGPLAARVRAGWEGEPLSTHDLLAALWELVWAGRVGNDTFAPVRGLLGRGRTAHKSRARTPRARSARPGGGARLSRLRRLEEATGAFGAGGLDGEGTGTPGRGAGMPVELGPADAARAAGRWSLLPAPLEDPTIRAHAAAEALLERYGVITRGSVVAEEVPGGFGTQYRLLTRMEEAGQVRRGYYVEHLGAAQFSTGATVDRLRGFARQDVAAPESPPSGPGGWSPPGSGGRPRPGRDEWSRAGGAARPDPGPPALALAATDPANPYGAALPWPELPPGPDGVRPTGQRPGRKAGAVVVLVAGELVLYVERGGRTLLCFSEDPEVLGSTARALEWALRTARVEKMSLEKVNGLSLPGTALAEALLEAGFYSSPSGVRFRS
ncbi:DEAD/DEAH box helicase [Citricoccus sp. SGAir0253]|uniref:Lhr family ATP-dependent helicase n=1 Tax=Citricoccus sp. SGAir0253 TaxID=2567881 RepID=UPI0010CD3C9D|nr:DEAD/DEAH box helicase [Citricoccus sp. SGAir0253]QCU78852.1 DEAD/DEAH box helicase [Citricoccus sp. SGAir0253]